MVFSSFFLNWLSTNKQGVKNNLSIFFGFFVIFVDFTHSMLSSDLLQEQTLVWEWRNFWLLLLLLLWSVVDLTGPISTCGNVSSKFSFAKDFKPTQVFYHVVLSELLWWDFLKRIFLQGREYSWISTVKMFQPILSFYFLS